MNQNSKQKYNIKAFLKDLINIRALPANILSLSRLASPFIIPPLALAGNLPLALLAGAGFALTDFADGKIARALNGQTKLGANLDAICDKISAAGLLICLIPSFPIMAIPLALEGVIAGINIHTMLKYKTNPESTLSGKLKMWPLSLTTIAGYITLAGGNIIGPISNVITYVSLLATIGLEIVNIDDYKVQADEAKIRKQFHDEDLAEAQKEQSKQQAIEKIKKNHERMLSMAPTTYEQVIDNLDDIETLKEIKKITSAESTSTLSHGQKIIKHH